jgi:triosephosphate isomerase
MRQVIAGNWKMNGKFSDISAYAAALSAARTPAELIVCPPFPLLAAFAAALHGSSAKLGAQDCHANVLLAEVGARYVILGHSERRADHGETNADIAAKVLAAAAAGLVPIVCCGETEAERDAGKADQVVCSQLALSLPPSFTGLVAYEPIWAIGTGRTPSEADVAAIHGAIRAALVAQFPATGAATPILYGGSVKPGNAASLLALPEVGGALVGGASLNVADFLAIAAAAQADADRAPAIAGRAPGG